MQNEECRKQPRARRPAETGGPFCILHSELCIRRAFTLLELILVIALIGLVAAVAWPDFWSFARREQLEQSADRIKSLVSMCRAQAMNDARRYRVTFRPDGRLDVERQRDPLTAPHEYVRPATDWVGLDFVLEHVWVEAAVLLPDGPPPILVEDDQIEFTAAESEPQPVQNLDPPVQIDFEPDGSCGSARWVLRDTSGRGLQMTLDGRLGRMEVTGSEPIPASSAQRPPPLEEKSERTPTAKRGRA